MHKIDKNMALSDPGILEFARLVNTEEFATDLKS